jgi:chromatin segregation and condensation protein Rec8/ScpA/Scc1 (kleisin family)
MAAMLIEIKSRMLLPPKKTQTAPSPRTRAPNSCAAWSNTSR